MSFMGVTWSKWDGIYLESEHGNAGPIVTHLGLVEAYDRLAYARNGIKYTRRPWPVFPTEPEPVQESEVEPLETAPPKKNGRRKS